MSEPTIEEMAQVCDEAAASAQIELQHAAMIWGDTSNRRPEIFRAAAHKLRAMQAQTEHEPLTTAEIRMAGQRAGMMMAAALLDERGWLKDAAKLIREEANKYLCNCGAGDLFHDLPCPLAVPGPVTELSQGEYDALVRDAMSWRPRKEPTAWIDAEMVAWLAKRRANGKTAVVSAYATERDDIATGDRVPLYAMQAATPGDTSGPSQEGATSPAADPPPPEYALLEQAHEAIGDLQLEAKREDERRNEMARDWYNELAALLLSLCQRAAAAEARAQASWQTMDSAPLDGTEVLLRVELRAGIPGRMLVGHYMEGGHCIEDHPPIDAGWYFWNGQMFNREAKPMRWMPLPAALARPEPEGK